MQKSKTPKLIAHRGDSGEAPENTLVAIQKAMDMGVDYIEIDVRLTKDGIPVVIHDPTLSRTTGGNNAGYVHDLTLEQIKTLDVGNWFDSQFTGEKIPTLEEVLLLTANKTGLMIEIKEGKQSPKTIVDSVIHVVESAKANLDFLKFGSFSIPIVQEIMKNSSLKAMGIIEEVSKIPPYIDLKVKHLAVWHKLINPNILQMLYSNSINVWIFTVDDIEIARALASLSVAGIITNQPYQMQQHLCLT